MIPTIKQLFRNDILNSYQPSIWVGRVIYDTLAEVLIYMRTEVMGMDLSGHIVGVHVETTYMLANIL